MPTLKLIATLATEGEKRSRSKLSMTKSAADDCCNDDRFSQPPDKLLAESRKKGGSHNKNASGMNNSSNGSLDNIAPFSIASAIRNHRNLHNSHGSKVYTSETRTHKGTSITTDIVAVVLSTAIRQAPPPNIMTTQSNAAKSGGSRIHLLIGDRSLPRGQCARVSMSISSNTSASLASLLGVDGLGGRLGTDTSQLKGNAQTTGRLGQLQPGDVVRWNRLEVRNDYEDESVLGKKRKLSNSCNFDEENSLDNRHHPLLSVVCDLVMSWKDPAAGPSLTRLCRIMPNSPSTHGVQPTMQKQQQCDEYDLDWESIIPPSMETSKDIVMQLASWYCENARPHFSKSTAILPTNQPCQRRKLRDINAPNLLSHVVVNALRCEKAISAYSTPRKATNDPVVTHVTLSDGTESDDLLGFGGSVNLGRIAGTLSSIPKSISAILLQSMREGSHVLLTHTLSHSINPSSIGGASLQGRESLILVPTRETTAIILTPDHPYFVHKTSMQEEANPFASQPLTLERASQLFSMTQQHSPPIMKDDSIPSSHCRGVMAVVAPLMDIIVDGINSSFIEGSHWQAHHKLSRFLIDCPSISTGLESIKLRPSYRSATLILDPKFVSSGIVVNADGDALKLLCMDVPVEDMVVNDPTITSNPYLCHVGRLLKALCTERAPIRWVLEQERECNWFVTNATLLEI